MENEKEKPLDGMGLGEAEKKCLRSDQRRQKRIAKYWWSPGWNGYKKENKMGGRSYKTNFY